MNNQPDVHALAFADREIGDWVVCCHCWRVYKIGEYREEGEYQMCPYPGCSGDSCIDPIPLKKVLNVDNDKLQFLDNWRGSRIQIVSEGEGYAIRVVRWIKKQGGRIA